MTESFVSQPTADQEGGQDGRYTIAFATVDDATEVFDIINDAYSVETGNTGVAFKNELRLVDPLEEQMLHGYNNQTILKCVDTTTGKVVGVLSFEHRVTRSSTLALLRLLLRRKVMESENCY
jgi:hypothetical protein